MEVKLINYSQADGEYLIDSTSAQEMVLFVRESVILIIK